MTIAIYSGTFDPFTLGHEDVLSRACRIFDHVIVAVAADCNKKTFFTFEERIALAKQIASQYPNASAEGFSGLLCEFVKQKNATVIIRGVRNGSDFDYETRMASVNHSLNQDIQTIFFPPMDNTQFISGTLVREIRRLGGDVSSFVSPLILQALNAKYEKNSH